ncbi:GNAT family N-acetyltransferase [Saccharopolyspora griseoalba]|uniref:GNAT family N-acetyltransferase n=1 Tax=Saccharopolyspora griseoalba TaxID=1431848 RepID=A0ABW2LMG6_9PSEU
MDLVFEIERASLATWPASEVERRDGWLLRHCERLPRRRSNSAVPLDPGAPIETAERFYAERGAAPRIQVSPLERCGDLDAALADRGYRIDAPVTCMRAERAALTDVEAPDFDVVVDDSPHPRWLAAVVACGGKPEPALERMPLPVGFAVAARGGNPVGVGMFAVSAGWCAVYGMRTSPDWRRRGVAAALIRAGARWAVDAQRIFLQVEDDNPVARSRYESLGFLPSHRYHYRIG